MIRIHELFESLDLFVPLSIGSITQSAVELLPLDKVDPFGVEYVAFLVIPEKSSKITKPWTQRLNISR